MGPVPRAGATGQPLLVLDRRRGPAADPGCARSRADEVDAYVPAAAAMFTEELGISPYACVAAGTTAAGWPG